uniref:Uncharacterized protein n=1 Tax=Panagrolaimus sp. JU765 TaxID=591449 RepID=A0AC34QBQ7_9BILA
MYSVMPQNFGWVSSTSSSSDGDDAESDFGYEIKEEEHYGFLGEPNKNGFHSSIPPLAPFLETTASLSSAFAKRDKVAPHQQVNVLPSTAIKSEISSFDDMLSPVPQMINQHNRIQQQLSSASLTMNNNQTGNNDQMDICRNLILRHLVQDISTTCSKLYLPTNPFEWTAEQANQWVVEMCQQFQLPSPMFELNLTGRDLLQMSQEELVQKMPDGGDTIHAQLHLWKTAYDSCPQGNMEHQPMMPHRINENTWNPQIAPKTMENYGSQEYYGQNSLELNQNIYYNQQQQQYSQQMVPNHQQRQMQNSSSPSSFFACNQQIIPSPSDSELSSNDSCVHEEEDFADPSYLNMASNFSQPQLCNQINPESGYSMPMSNGMAQAHLAAGNGVQNPSFTRNTGTVHLWHFIRELLDQPKQYSSCVRWVDREEGTFKIESSHHLARFWGQRKNRAQMNYDKLSRSLRQYYKKGIIQKPEKKQRLVYKFLPPYNL